MSRRVAPPLNTPTPAPSPVASGVDASTSMTKSVASSSNNKNKFKTIAVLLVVSVAAAFLIRTVLAARKKKASKKIAKDNETNQWQSYFSKGESAHVSTPSPTPAPIPAPVPVPVHTPAHPRPVAYPAAPVHAPLRPRASPADSNITGGRPSHTILPQATRPPRENENDVSFIPPPADIVPKHLKPSSGLAPGSGPEDRDTAKGSDSSDFTEI